MKFYITRGRERDLIKISNGQNRLKDSDEVDFDEAVEILSSSPGFRYTKDSAKRFLNEVLEYNEIFPNQYTQWRG